MRTTNWAIYNEDLWKISIIENPEKIEFDYKAIKSEAEVLSKIEECSKHFARNFLKLPPELVLVDLKNGLQLICNDNFKDFSNNNQDYCQAFDAYSIKNPKFFLASQYV